MSSRHRFITTLAALAPLAAWPRLARAQGAASRTPVSINLTATQPDVLPFYYGIQEKEFERAGLELTYEAVASGSLAMTAVLAGAANIGFGNPYTVVVGCAKGAPLEFVACANDSAATAGDLFVLADSPFRRPKDLEDHTLAVTGLHDLNAISARALVDSDGGDSSKLHFIEVPISATLPAIQAKRVDGSCVSEPVRSQAVALGFRSLGKPYAAIAKQVSTGAWFADRGWVSRNRDAALRFAEIIRSGSVYANAHFDELIPLISSYSKVEPEVIRKENHPHYAGAVTPALIQPLIDVASRYKEIPATFRAEDIILSR